MSVEANEAKMRGNAHFSHQQWDSAIKEFTEAIKHDPSQHVFFSNRSACYLELGDSEAALKDAEECIRLNPTWPKGYSRKAHALYRLKRFEESAETYSEGLKLDPENAGLKEGLALVQRQLSSSRDAFNPASMFANIRGKLEATPEGKALLSDPDFMAKLSLLESDPKKHLPLMMSDPKVMQAMSLLLKGMGVDLNINNSAAQNDNETPNPETNNAPKPEAPETKPKQQTEAECLREQGNSAYKKRHFDEAISLYSRAYQSDPKNILSLTNRAAVYMMTGDLAKARADCEEALEVGRREFAPFKQIAKALERLGDISLRENERTKAVEYYRQSLLESSEYAVKKKMRTVQSEIAEEERRSYLDPEKALVHKERGNALFKQSKFEEALKEYTESLKRNPQDAKVYCNRAAVYSKLMAWEYAMNDCEKSIEIDPTFAKAYLRKGKIEHLLKDYKNAVKTFNAGLKFEPSSTQLQDAKRDTMIQVMTLGREGKFDKEHQAKAMTDPDIQEIMNDPQVRETLEAMKTSSPAGNRAFQNPEVMEKIEILMAAGMVQIG